MPRPLLAVLCFCGFFLGVGGLYAGDATTHMTRCYIQDANGHRTYVRVIHHFWWKRIVHPPGRVDPRIDPKLRHAATIAEERANAQSKSLCWRYVKRALLAAGVVDSYPKSAYATEAGEELVHDYGFRKLPVHDPYAAPVGAVLVYGGRGHVEIRTRDGFASDYRSKDACFYPLLAVYGKFSS
jgi:hypothetical protein